MLDINLFRVDKGGNPDLVRESQRMRGHSVPLVDEIIAIDDTWRKSRFEADAQNKQLNLLQKKIGLLIKAGKKDEIASLLLEKSALEVEKARLEEVASEIEKGLNKKLLGMGNIVHSSVVFSMDERDNKVVGEFWPEGRSEEAERAKRLSLLGKDGKGVTGLFSHHEVLSKIEGNISYYNLITFYKDLIRIEV